MDIKKIAATILAALFIAGFAQLNIEVPLNKENISTTGQTFAILLSAFFLGRWYGALAVVIYILLGAVGLPVFSDGASGIKHLYGGSAGYFAGFIYAAYQVGVYGEEGWRRTFLYCLLAMLIGTLFILSLGVIRLSFIYGFVEAMNVGFYPFLLGGVVKVIAGGIFAFLIEKSGLLKKLA